MAYNIGLNVVEVDGTGAPATREIITFCDSQFGRVLAWWEAEGRTAGVQLIIVSDHGHVTAHSRVSVIDELKTAGFVPGHAPAARIRSVISCSVSPAIASRVLEHARLCFLPTILLAQVPSGAALRHRTPTANSATECQASRSRTGGHSDSATRSQRARAPRTR